MAVIAEGELPELKLMLQIWHYVRGAKGPSLAHPRVLLAARERLVPILGLVSCCCFLPGRTISLSEATQGFHL